MSAGASTVWITGAAGHLGRAVAARFARDGARLVLVDRTEALLQAAFGTDGNALQIAADLTDSAALAASLAAALDAAGRVDVWCHVAGGFQMGDRVHETTDAAWDLMFDLNARAFVNAARSLVPSMIDGGGGAVVTVGAAAAARGAARSGAYGASKAALLRLTESMSDELRGHRVRVNAVLPGVLDTADNRAAMPGADASNWVSPDALADVVAFLASDAARAVHGAAVPVTGPG